MSNRQNKSKPMSISDISKRMITRSQIREQSSTSVPNPPKVTNTEPTNITVDGYSTLQTLTNNLIKFNITITDIKPIILHKLKFIFHI